MKIDLETKPEESFRQLPVLSISGRDYNWNEILAWADSSLYLKDTFGYLSNTEKVFELSGELNAQELQNASNQFRYSQNLITTEETQKWLDKRLLNQDDLFTYLYRMLGDQQFDLEVQSVEAWFEKVEMPSREIWSELHFNNTFDTLIRAFSSRVIALEKNPSESTDVESVHYKSDEAACLENAYIELAEKLCTSENLQQCYKENELDFLEINYETLLFDTLNQAREAWCCLNYDKQSYAEIAKDTNCTHNEDTAFVKDLPSSLNPHFITTSEKEI